MAERKGHSFGSGVISALESAAKIQQEENKMKLALIKEQLARQENDRMARERLDIANQNAIGRINIQDEQQKERMALQEQNIRTRPNADQTDIQKMDEISKIYSALVEKEKSGQPLSPFEQTKKTIIESKYLAKSEDDLDPSSGEWIPTNDGMEERHIWSKKQKRYVPTGLKRVPKKSGADWFNQI